MNKLTLECEGHTLVITRQSNESNESESPSFFNALLSGRWQLQESETVKVHTPYKYMSVICEAYNTGKFDIKSDVPAEWNLNELRELLLHCEFYCLDGVISCVCVELLKYVLLSTNVGIDQYLDGNNAVKTWPGKKKKTFVKFMYIMIAVNALKPGKIYKEQEATELIWEAGTSGNHALVLTHQDRLALRRELVERKLVFRKGAPTIYKLNMDEIRNILFTGDISTRGKAF